MEILKKLKSILSFSSLSGSRTYLMGVLMIIQAIVGLCNGDTSGLIELISNDNFTNMIAGAGLMSLRAGIAANK